MWLVLSGGMLGAWIDKRRHPSLLKDSIMFQEAHHSEVVFVNLPFVHDNWGSIQRLR